MTDITINPDLSSVTVLENQKQMVLGPVNPETQIPFADEDAVRAYIASVEGKPGYFTHPEQSTNYADLSFPEFAVLVRQAGGMTAAKAIEFLQSSQDDEIIFLRMILTSPGLKISRDNPTVVGGLATLVSKQFITDDGKDTILAAWPKA